MEAGGLSETQINKTLIVFYLGAALLLMGLTARQAAVSALPMPKPVASPTPAPTVLSPQSFECFGEISNGTGGMSDGPVHGAAQIFVAGVDRHGCFSLEGVVTLNFSDGASVTVTVTGTSDAIGGGKCSVPTANGTPSTAGQAFIAYGNDLSGNSTRLTGCTQTIEITANRGISAFSFKTTGPLVQSTAEGAPTCNVTGTSGILLCRGTPVNGKPE